MTRPDLKSVALVSVQLYEEVVACSTSFRVASFLMSEASE